MRPMLSAAACFAALAPICALAQTAERPQPNRFQFAAPFSTLPGVTLDVAASGLGAAQQTARARGLQARILWIDATANLDRVNSAEKIQNLVRRVKEVGFNTIVFDVKPIVGYTLYPSRLTDKLTQWRGQTLPRNFDPLKVMVAEAKRNGLSLFASMNAFSEGHRMAKEAAGPDSQFGKPGPGYENPDQQTVLYEPTPFLRAPFADSKFPINTKMETMPTDGNSIGVFTKIERASKPPAGATGVLVDERGIIISVRDSRNWDFFGIPMGGSLMVGTGEAGSFISKNCRLGSQLTIDTVPSFVKISERPEQQIPLMMNPHHPEVQNRVLAFIREVLGGYAVDGIIFDDRLRYGGMNADFSDLTRKQFEKLVGKPIRWPQDVFEFTYQPDMTRGIRPGPYYDAWMTFRAETMRHWVARARDTVHAIRKDAQFGVYAGSWFGEYHKFGNNWSSVDFQAGFSFLTDGYRKTGFANELDFLITGCYYKVPTVKEAMELGKNTGHTVESAGQLSNRAVRDQAWSYAGVMLQDFYGNPKGLMGALQAAAGTTQGVMVFDLSHRIDEFWPIFERAFKFPAKAPHQQPSLLAQVRELRTKWDKMGVHDPAVTIREGQAGAGQ